MRQNRRSASTSTVIASERFGSNATVSRVRGGGEYLFTMGNSHWTVICESGLEAWCERERRGAQTVCGTCRKGGARCILVVILFLDTEMQAGDIRPRLLQFGEGFERGGFFEPNALDQSRRFEPRHVCRRAETRQFVPPEHWMRGHLELTP